MILFFMGAIFVASSSRMSAWGETLFCGGSVAINGGISGVTAVVAGIAFKTAVDYARQNGSATTNSDSSQTGRSMNKDFLASVFTAGGIVSSVFSVVTGWTTIRSFACLVGG